MLDEAQSAAVGLLNRVSAWGGLREGHEQPAEAA